MAFLVLTRVARRFDQVDDVINQLYISSDTSTTVEVGAESSVDIL